MVTINGAIRSYTAAVRRIERESQRQNREAARRFKEQQKQQAIFDAEQAVENWERYVETIKSIHKDCSEKVQWIKLNKKSEPKKSKLSNINEEIAKNKLNNYTPSFFDKLFGLTAKHIKKLENEIHIAQEKDKYDFENAEEQYQNDLKEWKNMQTLSNGILNKNPEFFKKALEYYEPFSDISAIGVGIHFAIEKEWIDVELHVNSDEIIPNYVLSQTTTGKLSKKNMPKTQSIELYQDHICSVILRVAREIFALLPIEYARINAISNLLNTQTGFLENKTILSVIIRPETLNKINFNSIDPSDCMSNFVHTMKFKKTTGFDAVEKAEFS